MSARRVIDWRIEPDGDDYTLLYRNKQVLHGRNMADIQRYLKKHRTSEQTVFQVAEDGYTTNLTPQMNRRQRSSRPSSAPRPRVPMRMPLMRF
jgi:hypothetical protein